MAVKIGTAADHLDFWDILLDFLQNDPALVAASQNWAVAWQHASNPELVLRGPGLSGDDQVLVGLRRRDDELTFGESVIDINGMTGIIPSATDYGGHVGNLPAPPLFFLDQNPMQYWIVANGRRFVVVLRISNIYQACYGGLFLPYASPAAYPMPLFVGGVRGSAANSSAAAVDTWRWGITSRYSHFVYPQNTVSTSANGFASSAYMLDPSGGWRECGISPNDETGQILPLTRMGPRNFPYRMAGEVAGPAGGSSTAGTSSNSRLGYLSVRERLTAGLNGEFSLTPLTLNSGAASAGVEAPVTYGILDGCFSVPGVGNVAENIISSGGVDHLVVGNVQRNSVDEYWALALE